MVEQLTTKVSDIINQFITRRSLYNNYVQTTFLYTLKKLLLLEFFIIQH